MRVSEGVLETREKDKSWGKRREEKYKKEKKQGDRREKKGSKWLVRYSCGISLENEKRKAAGGKGQGNGEGGGGVESFQ